MSYKSDFGLMEAFEMTDDVSLAGLNVAELETARTQICDAYGRFYGLLKAQADSLPVSDTDRRWIDPDLNGLEDVMTNLLGTLDNAITQAFDER